MRRRLSMLLLLLLPACTWWSSQDQVLITSDPLGARILIDGTDTGRTTPAKVAVAGNFGRDHVVTLNKRGYRPAQRRLYQFTEGYTSKWIDGAYSPVMLPLPLFWTAGDFVFPFGIRGALLPAELHVQLQRDDEPLLGFDLLAAPPTAADAKAP
jgi:PEGA domain